MSRSLKKGPYVDENLLKKIIPKKDAFKIAARSFFKEKYPEMAKVYFIGNFSVEFCGGPHVDFTSRLKSFKIIKQENIGNKKRRIYARGG